ncbi:hypothetical protein QQF64_034636 [Cirrhinus molitorella]|uniref:AIG1-type G domain-containing protein n=1 Tax=Cirrhinus molitorella TaxID=172907 RepID=A0ABR3L132_9TELE
MRIVLLGLHADVKVSCGNTIFGRKVFSESPSSLHLFERHDGMVLERRVVLINTPDLFSPALSPDEQDVRRRFHQSCPEPHALLLVFKSGTFTEQDRDALKLINLIFGEGSSEYVIVVFMHEEQEYVSIKDSDTELVKSLLQTNRHLHYHLQKNGDLLQVQKLLESIEKMVEEKGGHQLKIPEHPIPFWMKEATVCQTTNKIHKGLFDTSLSNEEIQQEMMRCIELLAPGPHVFLLVIAVGPFTKEERETLQLIKMTFGQKAETYTMEAERAFRLMQMNREKEEELRQEIEAVKATYESEIKEIKDKLEEEKAKGKIREFLLVERGITMLRQRRENTDTEQTHVERKNDDQIEKQEHRLPGATDLDREIPETGRESDKDRKKMLKNVFESLKRRKRQGKKTERADECKTKEAESGEENVERMKDTVTDQQSGKDLPKNAEDERDAEKERIHQHYKEMEECRQKMEEAMRRYKETADMYAAELKIIEARNAQIIDSYGKDHGKSCVLQ